MPNPEPEARGALLRRLLREVLRHDRAGVLAAAALMLLVAVLEGSGLLVLAPMLGLVGLSTGPQTDAGGPLGMLAQLGLAPTLGGVLLGYLLLILLHSLFSWRRDLATAQLQQGLVDRLRMDLYRGIGRAEWSFLARTHSAELSHALNTDLGRINQSLTALLQLSTTAVMALAYLAIAFSLSAPLTGLTLALGGMLLLLLRRQHAASHAGGYHLTQVTRQLQGETSEFLSGLRLIKGGNLEEAAEQRYRGRLREARAELLAFTQRQAISRGLLRVGGALALAALTYLALTQMRIAPAKVLVLVFIFSRLFPFLSTLQQNYERLLYTLPAYAAFDAMRRRCAAAAEPDSLGAPPPFREALRLEQICYRPPEASADILREVSLDIPWLSTVALIGPSGAGKSTLADLVSGLLAPSAGRILIDGAVLRDRRAWRQCVAYVPQDGFLLNASVRDNLLWTQPDVTETELWEALAQAAADFVRELPQGLDTVLGERGLRLSGGERQRLAIARALLRRPQLLILDEATSALDRDSERRIQDSLTQLHGQLTILVIAHRLATVRDADRLYVVERGTVREGGSFEELSRSGYLARLGGEGAVHA
ncbi:ABC transporter ATP-binding protein [Solimonas sp. K1W22B-7]|uniref:ABC transporter ATP-binding protein n=1 Tax=Solimonas sp. K1W22B-7 TaxID=2303331 RepID=UPI0013C43816|nr:ABC transporter ATP-binding protein [Solimonas sp. K1W22B-7]